MLEPEQEQLLAEMVEAERGVPRDQREWWVASMAAGDLLIGPWGQREIIHSDLYELEVNGLVRRLPTGDANYVVSPQGRAHYAEARQQTSDPTERVEGEVRRLLDDGAFRTVYSAAYERWAEAEALLWRADSDRELTTVGHKAREAVQQFATTLVDRFHPPEVDPDPAHVNRRIGAVIALLSHQVGDARGALLNVLGDHSKATMKLTQRQEHGGQKEGEPLDWQDARRVVLHTAVVMSEIASAVEDSCE
jgi:hypothetical protein